MGYFVLALALFMPYVMLLMGQITDANWLFYKQCIKLLMMCGSLMIIFAYRKNETAETEKIRNKAVAWAMFLGVTFFFGNMLWKVATGDVVSADSSSFLTFLLLDVVCLEFGIKKAAVDRTFKGNRR